MIVDDEPLGRQRVAHLLGEHGDMEIVGTAENGADAIQVLRDLRPDLVFLDVQMPNRSGLDVLRELEGTEVPVTVFVTAHHEYAVDAFEHAAVDYLLKPFSDERFEEALARARHRLELRGIHNLRERLLNLLDRDEDPGGRSASDEDALPAPYLERIAVQMRGRMRVVPVKDIDYISASGVYAEIHVGESQYLVRASLQSLEEQLDPQKFFRIHRSEIVRLDRIELLLRGRGGEYQVKLAGGTTLRVSRARREELEKRLGRI